MKTAMEIYGISKTYDSFTLHPVDLLLPSRCIAGLIGQNGAGKTTLFKCILNLVRKTSGSVVMPGVHDDLTKEGIRRHVGYMPEKEVFYDWMKVESLLHFVSYFYQYWSDERCHYLLERYELEPNKRVKELSLGMRKKLALLLALSHRPRVLLLDEPMAGLDPVMKFYFLQDLRALVNSGEVEAIVISSHNLDEIERLVDRVAILRQGVLQYYDSKEGLLRRWNKFLFVPPPGQQWTSLVKGKVHFPEAGRAMLLSTEEPKSIIPRLNEIGASQIEVSRPNLQEIFLQVA